MEIEYGAVPEPEPKLKYDFTDIRSGATIWAATNNERMAITKAFTRWKESRGSTLVATSAAVGPQDTKGEGYRIWFKSEAVAIRPIVAAKLPKIENLDEIQIARMRYTGIETNEDIIAAVLSIGSVPGTVTEANEARKLLFAGKTPLQVERMERAGRASFEERQQSYDKSERQRERQHDWPEDDGRDVSPAYSGLTLDQRQQLRAEAMIENEDEYLKAMRSRPADEAPDRSFGAVVNGYSDFTTWKVRQKARMGGGEE